jgi:hypothetical protein
LFVKRRQKRCKEERKGAVIRGGRELSKVAREDERLFILLIDILRSEDLALLGRKFTWVQPNGACASRLDRIMVSRNWMEVWGDASLWALPRDVSDHCPIILKYVNSDWGPKPFRFNNYWLKDKEFNDIVAQAWSKPTNKGWMTHVFREKLKNLKEALKKWNTEKYGAIDSKVPLLICRIQELEVEGENRVLLTEELLEWKNCCEQLWLLLKSKDRLEFQKSKSKWVKEGDANTSYFHACVKGRRRSNSIVALKMGDMWLENPSVVKDEVSSYFLNHFSEDEWKRPTMEGVEFPVLTLEEAPFLQSTV